MRNHNRQHQSQSKLPTIIKIQAKHPVKPISAIKPIHYPKTIIEQSLTNTNNRKNILEYLKHQTPQHALSKKELLLKLQSIKYQKLCQHRQHQKSSACQQHPLQRSNTDNLLHFLSAKQIRLELMDKKRTVYSKLGKQGNINQRESSAKRSIGQSSEQQFLNQNLQFQSLSNTNIKIPSINQIKNEKIKTNRQYETQRKKVVSLGAGFKKRSTNNTQAMRLFAQKLSINKNQVNAQQKQLAKAQKERQKQRYEQYRTTRTISRKKLQQISHNQFITRKQQPIQQQQQLNIIDNESIEQFSRSSSLLMKTPQGKKTTVAKLIRNQSPLQQSQPKIKQLFQDPLLQRQRYWSNNRGNSQQKRDQFEVIKELKYKQRSQFKFVKSVKSSKSKHSPSYKKINKMGELHSHGDYNFNRAPQKISFQHLQQIKRQKAKPMEKQKTNQWLHESYNEKTQRQNHNKNEYFLQEKSIDEQFFESNGFGIVSSLQKFDVLSLEDKQGKIFNRLFVNSLAHCPQFINGTYQWVEVKILGYQFRNKKVKVSLLNSQSTKNTEIHVSRLSVKIDEQRLKELKERVKLKSAVNNQQSKEKLNYPQQSMTSSELQLQFAQSQYQLVYEYLHRPYWQRVKQARERLIQFRNSKKYQRYLNSLKPANVFTGEQICRRVENSLKVFMQNVGKKRQQHWESQVQQIYIPSAQLGLVVNKRVGLLEEVMRVIREQCIDKYDRHFEVMRDMFYNRRKYQKMELLIFKVEDFIHHQKPVKARSNFTSISKQIDYERSKKQLQLIHYSNIDKFSRCVQFIISSVQQSANQSVLNVPKLIRTKITLEKFTQQLQHTNKSIDDMNKKETPTLPIIKHSLFPIDLGFFISTVNNHLLHKVSSLRKLRDTLVQQINSLLVQSFTFPFTTRTPEFIHSVTVYQQSLRLKAYTVLNSLFIDLVNKEIFEKTVLEFVQWMDTSWHQSFGMFNLKVIIDRLQRDTQDKRQGKTNNQKQQIQNFHEDKRQIEGQSKQCAIKKQKQYVIRAQPQEQYVMKQIARVFNQFKQQLQGVDDLMGELLESNDIQVTDHNIKDRKIGIFGSQLLFSRLSQSLREFVNWSYEKVSLSLVQNIVPYVDTYFNNINSIHHNNNHNNINPVVSNNNDNNRFILLQFSHRSIPLYQQQLTKINQDIRHCSRYLIHEVTIFSINLSQMRSLLLQKIRKQQKGMLKKIQRQLQSQIQSQYLLFAQYRQRLQYRPTDEEQLIQCRRFINTDCQDMLRASEQHYKLCEAYFQLMESHFYSYPFQLYIKHTRIINQQSHLQQLINDKLNQLLSIQFQLIERINNQRDTLSTDLDEMKQAVRKVIEFEDIGLLPKYYVETNKCYFKLEQIKHNLNNINSRQTLLKQELSAFKTIVELHNSILPYYQLHQAVHEVLTLDSQWKMKPLLQLSYNTLNHTLTNNLHILQQLSKLLIQQKNSSALSFADLAISTINKNLSFLWIVQHLTKQAIVKKPNILKESLKCIFQDQPYNLNELTISDILKQQLNEQKKSFIIEKSLIAQKVYNLQKLLQKSVSNAKLLQINFSQRNILHRRKITKNYRKKQQNINNKQSQPNPSKGQYESLLLTEQSTVLYLISCLQQQKQAVNIIEGNEVAWMIMKKISYVMNKLNVIQSTLQNIIEYQASLTRLYKIFQNEQIAILINYEDNKKYKESVKLWQNVVQSFMKQQVLWDAIESQTQKSKLIKGKKYMNEIGQFLQRLVVEKLSNYPKLYFFPKERLFEFLQVQPQLQFPLQFMQKLYGQGFKRFIYQNQQLSQSSAHTSSEHSQSVINDIIGIEGQLGEQFMFRKPILSKKIFWSKYSLIDEEISFIIKQVLNCTINRLLSKGKQQKSPLKKQKLFHQNQFMISYLLQQNIKWTQEIGKIISSQNNQEKQQLKSILLQQYLQINKDDLLCQQKTNRKCSRQVQIQRNQLKIQNKIYLRDATHILFNKSNQNLTEKHLFQLFPKYNLLTPTQTNSKNYKISLTFNTFGHSQKGLENNGKIATYGKEFILQFGDSLPVYSSSFHFSLLGSINSFLRQFQQCKSNDLDRLGCGVDQVPAVQIEFKSLLLNRQSLAFYKQTIQQTLNHFVQLNLQEHLGYAKNLRQLVGNGLIYHVSSGEVSQIRSGVEDSLKHIVTGFIFTQSYGVVNTQLNNFLSGMSKIYPHLHQELDGQILKFYAFMFQRIWQQIESKSFGIKLWDNIDIKVNRNYLFNLSLLRENVYNKNKETPVFQRLLQHRVRQVSLCTPQVGIICDKLVEAFAISVGLSSDRSQKLRKLSDKVVGVLNQQCRFSYMRIVRFFRQLLSSQNHQYIYPHQQTIKPELRQDNMVVDLVIRLLGKLKVETDFSKLLNTQIKALVIDMMGHDNIEGQNNVIGQYFSGQNKNRQIISQLRRQIVDNILSVQGGQISKLDFEELEQHYDNLQSMPIDQPMFTSIKQNFLQKIRNKLNRKYQFQFNKNKCPDIALKMNRKTKMLITGSKVLSMKTHNMISLMNEIDNCSFDSFVQSCRGQKYTQDLNNIICNYRNGTVTPDCCMQQQSNSAINNNKPSGQSTSCNKWHYIQQLYSDSIDSRLFYSQNKIIVQTGSQQQSSSLVNLISPSMIENVLFIHFPEQYPSYQQIANYEFGLIQTAIDNRILQQALKLIKVVAQNSHKIISTQNNKESQLKFIAIVKNYTRLISVFYQVELKAYMNDKNSQLNSGPVRQYLLMLLYWALYPFDYPKSPLLTFITAQNFNCQFPYPLNQIHNWYYSLSKKTWIQWVTFNQFIQINKLNHTITNNANIFVPTNQSLSFMFLTQRVSQFQNCLLLSESNNLRKSFLSNLILCNSRAETVKCYLYTCSQVQKVSKLLQKQVCKLTIDGEYIPSKNRQLKFIIQDINLQCFQQKSLQSSHNFSFPRSYLLSLLHKSYDLRRKKFIKRTNFLVSIMSKKSHLNQSKCDNDGMQQAIIKQMTVVKLRQYTEESLQYVFRQYLQQFFGSTENPYSKQVRSMSQLIIYQSMQLKSQLRQTRNGNSLISKLQSVFLSLRRSSPKVIKTYQDILSLFNFQMKRQFGDFSFRKFNQQTNNRNNHIGHIGDIGDIKDIGDIGDIEGQFVTCYNRVLNGIIQKLFINQSLSQHKLQLGLQSFQQLQQIQNLRNFLAGVKFNEENGIVDGNLASNCNYDLHSKAKREKFNNEQSIFTLLQIQQNSDQYSHIYRRYPKGITQLQQLIQLKVKRIANRKYLHNANNRPQNTLRHISHSYQTQIFLSKQRVSDVIKLNRVFVGENSHALIIGNSKGEIITFIKLCTQVYFDNQTPLHILEIHPNTSVIPSLITLLKSQFKLYLKQLRQKTNQKSNLISDRKRKLPILVMLPEISNRIEIDKNDGISTHPDIPLFCQYLSTGQFLSIVFKLAKHKPFNLLKKLKIKTTQSQKYQQFKHFCHTQIHFIIGAINHYQNQRMLQNYRPLVNKVDVGLQLSEIGDQSKMELSIRCTSIVSKISPEHTKLTPQQSLLPYYLFKLYQKHYLGINNQRYSPFDITTKYHQYCQSIHKHLTQSIQSLKQNIKLREETINNINEIFEFKKYLERKLQRLKAKLTQMTILHDQKQAIKRQLQKIKTLKHQIYIVQVNLYETQLKKCKQLNYIVDEQTAKVGPILEKAQLVLEKVTRDDINQLRSFPNPPLSASKVCQSLIFLFDEVHLIKQKVLEGGQKVKDFWQYAKKFILNDKLVKRISDLNQQTIKELPLQVIETVRQIVSKPQLSEERVFKASSAAGNLSLFIRAVISTYDAIQMIEPKRKQLYSAQQLGRQIKAVMQTKKQAYQIAMQNLNNQIGLIKQSSVQLQRVGQQIGQVSQQIENIESLLLHLDKYKEVWREQIDQMKKVQIYRMFYKSIWVCFDKACLIQFTEHQIKQLVVEFIQQHSLSQQTKFSSSQNTRNIPSFSQYLKRVFSLPSGDKVKEKKVQKKCNEAIEKYRLIQVPQKLKVKKGVLQLLVEMGQPYSQQGGFIQRVQRIFESVQQAIQQERHSYWIVDETVTIRQLLQQSLVQSKSLELASKLGLNVVQIIDCLQYAAFGHYLIGHDHQYYLEASRNYHSQQPGQYSDDESDEEDSEQDHQQHQSQQQLNIHENPSEHLFYSKVVVVKNIQHLSAHQVSAYKTQLQTYFHSKNISVIFITDYDHPSLSDNLRDIDLKYKLSLTYQIFSSLFMSRLNLLMLKNTQFYIYVNQIQTIKQHQIVLLNKLRGKVGQNLNINTQNIPMNANASVSDTKQPAKTIQQLISDNEQVVKLCQDFIQMDENKIKLNKIYQAQQNKIVNKPKIDESANQWLKPLYRNRIATRQLGCWQFNNMVDSFVTNVTIKSLQQRCHDKLQQQVNLILTEYLNSPIDTNDHHHINCILIKFKQFCHLQEQKGLLKLPTQNKLQNQEAKMLNSQKLQFDRLINCVILGYNSNDENDKLVFLNKNEKQAERYYNSNVILQLYQLYGQKLIIVQPNDEDLFGKEQQGKNKALQQKQQQSLLYSQQIKKQYQTQSAVVILVGSLREFKLTVENYRKQLHKLIYAKCIEEKEMDEQQLLMYLNENQQFRLILLIQQQSSLIYPQLIRDHRQQAITSSNQLNKINDHQGEAIRQQDPQKLQPVDQNRFNSIESMPESILDQNTIRLKSLINHVQSQDQLSIIISAFLQPSFINL